MTRTRRSARTISSTREDKYRAQRDRRAERRSTSLVSKARTPRDLEAARARRKSARPKRARREWRAAVGAAGLAVGMGTAALPRISIPHIGWRTVSFTLIALLVVLIFHGMTAPQYFIGSINLAGARFVSGDEIYRAAAVHAVNAFWLQPDEIEARIEAIPAILDATIVLKWPPALYVEVVERAPILAWLQGGETVWIDQEGTAFAVRGELSDLLPIVVDDVTQTWPLEAKVPQSVIDGAMELKTLRPNIELLHYDSRFGLSYQDGRGWRGYFGVGPGMESRLIVYETLVDDLMARRVRPAMIDVGNPDSPYYRQ